MISDETIQKAARLLGDAAKPARVVLFGSYARGEPREDSDVDFLVVEPAMKNRLKEIVRLRQVLRPFRIPVDILVYTEEEVRKRKDWCSGALYWALREGKVLYDDLH
jgi:predicted nucleotidyltransferase